MKNMLLLVMTVLLGACNTMTSTPHATLDGEVYYMERIGLPETATYEVSLQDISLADAPAMILAQYSGPTKGQIPLPFHLTYDPAQVKPGHKYAIIAKIENDGRLLFINMAQHTVDLSTEASEPIRVRVNIAPH